MLYTKISVIIKDKPPYFIGSQLRGAFGYALKKVTCINPSFKCEECFAKASCLYYEFYEQKNKPHKYRFDFELGRDFYDFSLYLFDDATTKLPYALSALNMMLSQNGLGVERRTYKEFDIYIDDKLINKNSNLQIPKNSVKTFQIDKICQNITIQFITPLRVKKSNRFIRDDNIELKDIVNSIYQRQMQLLEQGYKKFPYPIEGQIVNKELHYKELTRMSNRQKSTMNLGGLLGSIEVKNINKEAYEVLKVGELIGAGKQCVFGLGKIKVEDNDE